MLALQPLLTNTFVEVSLLSSSLFCSPKFPFSSLTCIFTFLPQAFEISTHVATISRISRSM